MKVQEALFFAKNNYNTLPEPLQKSYMFMNKVTKDGTDFDSYKTSDGITKTINLAVEKLNEIAVKSQTKNTESKNTAKPKRVAKQKTKPEPKEIAPSSKKQVEALPDEIVIMKRYLGFHEKEKTRGQVMNLIDALQKSVLKKKIRKTSPFASIINTIQKKLIKGYTSMQSNKVAAVEIKIDKDFYNKVKTEVDSFEALTSVKLINRYINLDGEKQSKEKALKLSKDIDKFLSFNTSDPYLVNLREISTYLETYLKGKHSHLVVNEQALAGLPWALIAYKTGEGVKAAANSAGRVIKQGVEAAKPYVKKAVAKSKQVAKAAYVAAKTPVEPPKKNKQKKSRALGSVSVSDPVPSEPGAIIHEPENPLKGYFEKGSDTTAKSNNDTFRLIGDLGVFLGDLEQNELGITIDGDQGGGKTQLAFQIANGLLDVGKNGAMLCYEIPHNSVPMRKFADTYLNQINRNKILYNSDSSQGIDFINKTAPHLDWMIIDSWPKLRVSPKDFDIIRKKHKNCIFIVVLQRLSSGDIRGGNDALYDAGINIEVEKVDNTFVNNYALTSKNRYGQSGLKYNIHAQKLI